MRRSQRRAPRSQHPFQRRVPRSQRPFQHPRRHSSRRDPPHPHCHNRSRRALRARCSVQTASISVDVPPSRMSSSRFVMSTNHRPFEPSRIEHLPLESMRVGIASRVARVSSIVRDSRDLVSARRAHNGRPKPAPAPSRKGAMCAQSQLPHRRGACKVRPMGAPRTAAERAKCAPRELHGRIGGLLWCRLDTASTLPRHFWFSKLTPATRWVLKSWEEAPRTLASMPSCALE
jgi:hypothetical protein